MCTKLEHLYINYDDFIEHEWLLYEFPTLQHLTLMAESAVFSYSNENICKFLEKNPKIRCFSTERNLLMDNKDSMEKSNVHLDDFEILCNIDDELSLICTLLNTLFKEDFYERLLFRPYGDLDQTILQLIASLEGLDTLYLESDRVEDFVETPMPQLKEFRLDEAPEIENSFDKFVNSFVNIERIYFEKASFYSILPFLRGSAKLKKIKIQTPEDDGIYCNEGIIDLSALDRERKKCAATHKIELFVGEKFYLETKEALMEALMEKRSWKALTFDVIELKRAESEMWDLDIEFID